MSWMIMMAVLGFEWHLLKPQAPPPPPAKAIVWTADYCGACKKMHPAVDRLAAEGWAVTYVDASQNAAAQKEWGVDALPTVFIYQVRDGETKVLDACGYATYEELLQRFQRFKVAKSVKKSPQT